MNRDMLDITKKARAYDKALKRAKEWMAGKYGHYVSDTPQEIAEFIFPELKENEDEKMWKAIYNALKYLETELSWDFLDDVDILDVYAWLKKQSEMNIQNNKPFKIESDKFYFCIKDYFAGGCYRSKKGDIVLAKNGMNMMGLSPEQASEYFIPINPFKEHVVVDWFEKEREKSQGKSALEALQEKRVNNANKIEPKFKYDDFILDKRGIVYKVIGIYDVTKNIYCLKRLHDNVLLQGSISIVDNEYHLWTIDDAKEGDVLSYVTDEEDLWIMLYWSLYEPYEGHVHYHALLVNDNFSDKGTCCIDIDYLKPATKEQRELLFTKMKEAGYEWNFDKKELKKIEDVPENYKQQVMSEMTNLVKDYIQQKPIWSEEDNKRINRIYDFLWKHKRGFSAIIWQIEEDANWLKSLKDRYTWKPTEEQINAIRLARSFVTDDSSDNPTLSEILLELEKQLKKIMEE